MNLIKTLTRFVLRPATLALAILGCAAAAEAANIKMECRVAGYSTAGWIEVRPGSGTGGRVQRDAAGRYYTDRVQRGEAIRINFTASTPSEYCQQGALTGAFWDNGSTGIYPTWLPFSMTGRVPTNVNMDNVYVWVVTSSGGFDKRIPIGSR